MFFFVELQPETTATSWYLIRSRTHRQTLVSLLKLYFQHASDRSHHKIKDHDTRIYNTNHTAENVQNFVQLTVLILIYLRPHILYTNSYILAGNRPEIESATFLLGMTNF